MEQLRQHLPLHKLFFYASIVMLLASIAITQIPWTSLFLPLIAYCCYRLYKQLQLQQLDVFNVFFDVGCMLTAVTLFITAHTLFY